MTRAVFACFALAASAGRLAAQPGIGQNGVVNAASQIAPTLPGGALARGALFTISGVRFGTAGSLAVAIRKGESVLPVRILSTTPERIDALVPAAAPVGPASLVVTAGGQPSLPFPIEIVESNPGLFSRNGQGWGPGRIDNLETSGSRRANTLENPARPGRQIVLSATGLASARPVTAFVGNRAVRAGAPISSGRPGEQQILLTLPANVPEGCFVPVYLEAAPLRASNVVTIAISSAPGPCRAALFPVFREPRIAAVTLSRIRMRALRQDGETVSDQVTVTLLAKGGEPLLSPPLLIPPPGTCAAYTSSFQSDTVLTNPLSGALAAGHGLDAGPQLTLTWTGETREVYRTGPGSYRSRTGRGGLGANPRLPGLFLETGRFTLRGPGGKDAGPFTWSFDGPAPFDWTDREQSAVVVRSHGLTVHWKGADSAQLMVLLATNVDKVSTAIGSCMCTASAAAGHLTVPADLLANIPASRDMPGPPYDQLHLASVSAAPRGALTAPGMDSVVAAAVYVAGRFVQFR
jgi:uncharacterized protein (TIGR03437 family)